MAQHTIYSLNSIKATTNELMFSLSVDNLPTLQTYIANVEKYDNALDSKKQANKFCLSKDGNVIHNMYDAKRTLFHHLAARRHLYPYESQYDYQHIYKAITDKNGDNVPLSMINTVQSYNTLYSLQDLTNVGHYYVNDKLYTYLCRDNELSMPYAHDIDTLLYDKNKLSNDLSNCVKTVMKGVEYNIVYEIPGNIYQSYKDGSIYATTFKTKNQYDASYSMSKGKDNTVLSNARQYLNICNCNNQVYLKYKDNIKYTMKGRYIDSYATSAQFCNVEKGEGTTSLGCNNIPQIEVIKNINRGINCSKHKSTLYSINVNTTKIFSDDCWKDVPKADKIKDNIKKEIKNYVRTLTSRIAPANTQLFAVTVQ